MSACARAGVWASGDWWTASRITELAGSDAEPDRWKDRGDIFALPRDGVDHYPGYALDRATGYRPRKVLRAILDVFGDAKDGWGLAFWFLASNGFLGGRAPRDMLAEAPWEVLAAAHDEVEGPTHA